jgi:glycerophosphoryl diester phosphodiesterase
MARILRSQRGRLRVFAAIAAIAVTSAVAASCASTTPQSTSRATTPTSSSGQSTKASGDGVPATPRFATNPFKTGHTLVIPHGGGDGLFPEDTLVAYQRTLAMGADVVDVDLQKSSDGVVIAFHDATVDRITGATGTVAKMTYGQLSHLDAGWAFTTTSSEPPDPTTSSTSSPTVVAANHPFRGLGITIPTLAEILDQFPTALLSLDLKDESLDMVQPVCDLLVGHERFNDVFVGSNNDEQILQFRKQCPGVRTSATMVDVYADRRARASNDTSFVPEATVDQPPFRANGRQLVDGASLAWAHSVGIAILTWVVNDEADMRLLVDLGVDGMYTSYPDRLLKILGRCHNC